MTNNDNVFKFFLGQEVKDIISGFQGIVTSRSEWLDNESTYGVKPEGTKDDGSPKEEHYFDLEQLEAIGENDKFFRFFRECKSFEFGLGDAVTDKITKLSGVIIGRTQWFNGCCTYTIQPTELYKGAPQKNVSFDGARLTLVVKEKIETPINRTGGPPRPVRPTNRL